MDAGRHSSATRPILAARLRARVAASHAGAGVALSGPAAPPRGAPAADEWTAGPDPPPRQGAPASAALAPLRRAPVPPPPPLGGGDVDAVTLNELVAHAAAMLDHSIDALVRAVADETAAAPAMETPREAGGDRPGASPMVTAGSALYFLSRLEHGALMPSVCYSIAVRAGEPSAAASTPREGGDTPLDGALSDWCAFLGAFYAAFWGALTTAPLRRPVYGTAMGRPPTPRSVANWLRAHFGPDAAPQLPIGSTRAREAWARAAGDVIEALWSRAGRSRVPDALPGRRSLLHHRAMCDPEAPYVLVLAALADPLGIETVRSAALYAAPAGDGRGVVRPVAIGRAIDIAGGARMVRAWSSPESAALLAPLRLPSRVGPDAREALWRMLVALATGDPAAASTASMLAEHDRDAEGSDDDHDDWMGPGARSAAEGVRRLVLLDDRARIARLLPAVPSHPSLRADDHAAVRTASDASVWARHAIEATIADARTEGRIVVPPVRAVPMDACLLGILLLDHWHRRRDGVAAGGGPVAPPLSGDGAAGAA